jgi:diguanylate cyclase
MPMRRVMFETSHEQRLAGPRRHLDAAEETLCNSEHRLREILGTAPVAFISLDSEGLILDWNAEAELIFGWSGPEALGHKLAELILPQPTHGALERDLNELRRQPDSQQLTRHLKVTAVHRDGHEVYADLTISRLSAGDSHLFDVFVTDITAQQQADRDRRYAEEQLAHQALHDPLTGLPNRTLLFDRVGHALALAERHATLAAVICIDIDNFKLVNETLGHDAGDELLIQVVRRLEDMLRAADTLARFGRDTLARVGGDELVVLCEVLASEQDALSIAERILSTLSEPFEIADQRLFITVSIGIALTTTSVTANALVRDADTAMYRAKERGGSRYELFDSDTRARLLDRVQRVGELRGAIGTDELCVYFQPIVSVVDGRPIGAEALVRWQHPTKGLLAAGEFIPLAEQGGLITPLGCWVLRQAAAQLAQWDAGTGPGAPLSVFVNVSARQLAEPGFIDLVEEVIEENSIDPSRLILEITESTLIEDADERVETLAQLQERGVFLALDDFGTGYSSLATLKRLPVHFLKLDRSFVSGLGHTVTDPQIAAAVIEMARAMKLSVIAEGVETEEQLESLRQLGCRFAQGYYFARPMPASELSVHLHGPTAPDNRPTNGTKLTQNGREVGVLRGSRQGRDPLRQGPERRIPSARGS